MGRWTSVLAELPLPALQAVDVWLVVAVRFVPPLESAVAETRAVSGFGAVTDELDSYPGWEVIPTGDLTDQVYERFFSQDERNAPEIVLPTPCVSYATYGLLEQLAEITWLPVETAPLRAVVAEFYERAIEALREVTQPEQYIHAVTTGYLAYRLWPHRADPTKPWPLDIGDFNQVRGRGDEAFILEVGYSWGFCVSTNYLALRTEAVSIFGQPLIDAFEKHKPRLLGRANWIDGHYQAAGSAR